MKWRICDRLAIFLCLCISHHLSHPFILSSLHLLLSSSLCLLHLSHPFILSSLHLLLSSSLCLLHPLILSSSPPLIRAFRRTRRGLMLLREGGVGARNSFRWCRERMAVRIERQSVAAAIPSRFVGDLSSVTGRYGQFSAERACCA